MTPASRKTREDRPPTEPLERARRLFSRREYAEAAALFKEALEEGEVFEALCGEALCLYRMGRLSEALDLAARAARTSPERGEPHFISGLALKDAGRYDEAIESLNGALALGYRRFAAVYQRGAAHFLAGRLGEAERDFEEAAREAPGSAGALYNLGVVRVHRLKWREAAEAFSTCARLDPAGASHYHRVIFAIGRAQASEEFHFRGHRLKNMLALLADTCRRRSDHPAPGGLAGGTEIGAVVERLETVLAEMSELLSFVKREPLDLDVWDLHDVIDSALLAAADALSGVEVQKRFAANVPGVVCDAEALSEAFLNMILNAAEAMPDGGVLTIRTRRKGGDAVRVEFEDTGGGVKVQPPEKVFQFAFTTKAGGSGLGLCQASRTVDEHGGRIVVERAREGARFAVEVPLRVQMGEAIRDIGLRPELSEDIGLLYVEGTDKSLEVGAGG